MGMERFDIFGSKISFRFQAKDIHRTKFGALVTIALICSISIRLLTLVKHVIDGDEPTMLSQERQVDNPKRFYIKNDTFAFSLGLKDTNYNYYKDPRLFKATGIHVLKTMVYNESSKQKEPFYQNIPFDFVACDSTTFKPFGLTGNTISTSNKYHLCFPKDKELYIEGEFFSDNYADIRILLQKCTGDNCLDKPSIDAVLDNHLVEFVFSDTYISPEQKDNPFKFFARELYWPSSQNLPRDINIYMRNNYVESDFGWFSSMVQTDIYPSFSFGDWQIVDKSNDFFFKATIRFEKQKENLFKRSYQKAVSIMSELGGFSQILLTICYFICSFYSQTDLNRTLIDQTFSFKEDNPNENSAPINSLGNNNINLKKQKQLCQGNNKIGNSLNISLNDSKEKSQHQKPSIENNQQIKNMSFMVEKGMESLNEQNLNLSGIENQKRYRTTLNTKMNELTVNTNLNGLNNQYQNSSNNNNLTPVRINKTLNELLNETKEVYKNQQQSSQGQFHKNNPDRGTDKDMKIKENKFKQLLKKTANSINFSISKYILSFFCRTKTLKREKQIFDYSISQLYQHLDMQYIINKLIEVDKIKKVFLDEDQINLLEYLPRPVIQYSYDEKGQIVFNTEQADAIFSNKVPELKKIHRALQSFDSITKKKKPTKVDHKIIQLLDPKFDSLFKEQYEQININKIEASKESLKLSMSDLKLDEVDGVFSEFQNPPSRITSIYMMETMAGRNPLFFNNVNNTTMK